MSTDDGDGTTIFLELPLASVSASMARFFAGRRWFGIAVAGRGAAKGPACTDSFVSVTSGVGETTTPRSSSEIAARWARANRLARAPPPPLAHSMFDCIFDHGMGEIKDVGVVTALVSKSLIFGFLCSHLFFRLVFYHFSQSFLDLLCAKPPF